MFKKFFSTSLFILFSFISSCVYGQNRVINIQEIPNYDIPPKSENKDYLEFLALGDAGTGGDGQKLVAKALANQAKLHPISFFLLLGDNFYEFGVSSVNDSKWNDRFENIYSSETLNYPFYAVLGNHDYYGNIQAQIDYTKISPGKRWNMPAHYYTFSKAINEDHHVQFFALDTTPIERKMPSAIEQLKWLDSELALSTATWKVVFGHHVIFSGGSHGNNKELQKSLKPILEKYNVDLYLAGHDHDQQLLQPVNGIHYIVSGAGGKSRDVKWLKNTIFAATNFGFTHFRVTDSEITFIFLDGMGKHLYAHTIRHD